MLMPSIINILHLVLYIHFSAFYNGHLFSKTKVTDKCTSEKVCITGFKSNDN